MQFTEFLKQQNKIYSEIELGENTLLEKGSEPTKKIQKGQGMYLLAFLHNNVISNKVEKFSKNINTIVPSIVYTSKNVHTTISLYLNKQNFTPETSILKELTTIVEKSMRNKFKPKISFKTWLYNQNSVIAKGIPNKDFFLLASEIVKIAKKSGIELRYPKLSHITIARFLEKSSPNNFVKIIRLIRKEKPLGTSVLKKIAIGYFLENTKNYKGANYFYKFKTIRL